MRDKWDEEGKGTGDQRNSAGMAEEISGNVIGGWEGKLETTAVGLWWEDKWEYRQKSKNGWQCGFGRQSRTGTIIKCRTR